MGQVFNFQKEVKMAVYSPLKSKDRLSKNERRFFLDYPKDALTSRQELLIKVLVNTPRPLNPRESLFGGYKRLDKFHDGEPKLIVTLLENKCPHYFQAQPVKGNNNLTKKKSLVGRACKAIVKNGNRQYGKPKLRKG